MAFLPYDPNMPYDPYGSVGTGSASSTPEAAPAGGAGQQANVPMWMQPWSGSAYAASTPMPSYGGGWSDVSAPAAYGGKFDYQAGSFSAPTGLTYMNDPGYQARMKMGTDALESSAASRGSLLTGGTAKALTQFGQDYGSNEFQNVFNRALGGYQANEQSRYNAAALNQGGALQAHGIDAGNQMQASMANASGRMANANASYGASMGAYDRAYGAYRDDQAAAFNRPFSLASLGYNAASNASGQYGNSNANNAAQMGDYWTGAANANAAGQVAGGNAWAGALNNMGTTALGAYYMGQYGSPTSTAPQAGAPYTVNGGATPPPTTGYYGAYQPYSGGFTGWAPPAQNAIPTAPNYAQYWPQ